LLPKVSLIAERSPEWVKMASSWRKVSAPLYRVALTQFDAQLVETIRYDLAPKVQKTQSMSSAKQHDPRKKVVRISKQMKRTIGALRQQAFKLGIGLGHVR
jgi:hypothetical protein